MLATTKACLQLPQLLRFVGYAKDSMCFVELLPSLVKVFALQVMNAEPYLVRKEEVVESCKFFIKSVEAISSRRRDDSWAVPVGLVPVQTSPVHIMHFIGNM